MTRVQFLASESGKHFLGQMNLAGLRPVTANAYARRISVVARTLEKSPEKFDATDVERYLNTAAQKGFSGINAAITCVALKFYFERTLNQPWKLKHFPRVHKYRKQRSRPLSREEILQLLDRTRSLRFRLLFALIYGSGLRIGEACNLKITDVDFHSYKIYIRNGKGGRHRETVLSRNLSVELRKYLNDRRPIDWLFCSSRKSYESETLFPIIKNTRPISSRSAQHEFNLARGKLNLPGLVTIHSLRHSFATHLVEYNMPLFSVQRLLGHQHLSTTLGYLSSMGRPITEDFSPLDRINIGN